MTTVSKRLAAKIYRETANNLDKYGHVKNRWGNENAGFCAMGSFGHVCNKLGADAGDVRRVTGGPFFRNALWSLTPVESAVLEKYGFKERAGGDGGGDLETFNDHPDTTKRDVQKVMRQIAKAIEHGGKVS